VNEPRVIGCSAFGLKDCVVSPHQRPRQLDFYLADAVLPHSPFGVIRTGKEAEEERTHAGLNWPPEARVQRGEYLQRVPVPYAWRALVEAGDRTVRWNVGHGVSFSLSKILASYVAELLDQEELGIRTLENDLVVVAIPNHLDEFGQEELLKELAARGLRKVRLIWRPVAAALAWLDKIGEDFPQHMNPDDHIHVLYLGPDAVEFTTFRLRVYERKPEEPLYVLPLRDRPKHLLALTGMDWGGRVIEEYYQHLDDGAFWQAFTTFPEIWAAIAGIPWDESAIPRPWSVDKSWSLWNPPQELKDAVFNVGAGTSNMLREIISVSCPLRGLDHDDPFISWKDLLRSEVRRLLKLYQKGKLRGVILCGPLMPAKLPCWLESELSALAERGLVVQGPLDEPEAGRLWICPEYCDAVAEGSAIYGRRILDRTPTYLDTLPRLSILAYRQDEHEYDWIDLVDTKEVEGGNIFTKSIKGRFLLQGNTDRLEVYLRWGEGLQEEDSTFTSERPPALSTLFKKRDEKRSPFRKAEMRFPAIPNEDTILDLEVRMRPASGLAKVEIVPRESDFLKGRRVFLDYSLMRATDTLPVLKRGWPENVKIEVTDNPTIIGNDPRFKEFMMTPIDSENYSDALTGVKDLLAQGVQEWKDNQYIYLKKIDQDGQAGSPQGQECVDRISAKLEEDFLSIYLNAKSKSQLRFIVVRGTWLWGRTPDSIIKFLEEFLQKEFGSYYPAEWLYFVEAASRSFVNPESYKILFSAIYKRLLHPPDMQVPFPIQSARAIWRVLLYRPDGQDGLDKEMAIIFSQCAVDMLCHEVGSENLKQKFFQSLLLFFVLLRYRKQDQTFLSPDNQIDQELLDRLYYCLDKAENWFARYERWKVDRVRQLLNGIKDYMKYEGLPGILHLLTEMAEEHV